jgi:hypothetical protein
MTSRTLSHSRYGEDPKSMSYHVVLSIDMLIAKHKLTQEDCLSCEPDAQRTLFHTG